MKNDSDLRVEILLNQYFINTFWRPIVEGSLYRILCKFLNQKAIIKV